MIEFYRIYDVDNELYEFCLRQKGYYQLENIVITKEVLREFWQSLGFYKIADSHFGEIPVVVFQLDL